ncbi:MAG TPA: 6-carboxytetrahydropterin synthase QueD [Usitatibacter sp.]|jgi:6-pyruvoyltetrahydropterin/6-carboxytetrahydropterin synthase|nr:6-carboxytetrahydropterin synthase QueD [Usitatibacter sp.]HEX3097511.1 6-carboxytetrahydropterin synthase QueD [Usitatibacter sp.]
MRIYKDVVFEAAHRLPKVPPGHRCHNLHGHTFKCRIECEGPLDPELGWVVDFADVDRAVEPLMKQLDHRYLNDVRGLENPTSEVIAAWILERLRATGLPVRAVTISENDASGAIAE